MANVLNRTELIARAGAATFHAKGNFFASCDDKASKEFFNRGVSPGMSIQIPKPARYSASIGMNPAVQDTVQQKVPLTLVPITAKAYMTSIDKKLFLESPDSFEKSIAMPLALRWVRAAEEYLMGEAVRQTANYTGTPGTAISDYKVISDSTAVLNDMLVPNPDSVMAALTPHTHSALAANLKTLLSPATQIGNQYLRGMVRDLAGVLAWRSQTVPTLASIATPGTPRVNGADQTGSNLVTDGWTASTSIPAGTKFTVAVYALDPETKAIRSWLQGFTVLGTPTTDSDGITTYGPVVADSDGNATLPIYPPIIPLSASGNEQTVNVSPADNQALTVAGAGGTRPFTAGLVYAPEAFAVASASFEPFELKGASHVETYESKGIRVSIMPNIDNGNEIIRMDGLVGLTAQRPEWALAALAE